MANLRCQIITLLFIIGFTLPVFGQTVEPSHPIRHYSLNIDDLFTSWDVSLSPSGTLFLAGEHWFTEYIGHQWLP